MVWIEYKTWQNIGETNFQPREFPRSGSKAKDVKEEEEKREKKKKERKLVITMASYALQTPPQGAHASRLDQNYFVRILGGQGYCTFEWATNFNKGKIILDRRWFWIGDLINISHLLILIGGDISQPIFKFRRNFHSWSCVCTVCVCNICPVLPL